MIISFSLVLGIIGTLLVAGLLLWAIESMPFLSPNIKKLIEILIVVVAGLWMIGLLFPGISPVKVTR